MCINNTEWLDISLGDKIVEINGKGEVREKQVIRPLTNPDPNTNLQGFIEMDGQELKTGVKKDDGKPRWELLPYDVLAAVARILTSGARKYDSRNWEKGIGYGRVFGAVQRHLEDFWNCKLNGTDGINHADGNEMSIDHAITELMFLSAYEKRGKKEFDDRPVK